MTRLESGPVTSAESSSVDDLHLRAERLAEAVLVLVVHDGVAEARRDLHGRLQNAEVLREARRGERGHPALLAGHRGVDRTVALGIGLRSIEEVRIAEQRALADDD